MSLDVNSLANDMIEAASRATGRRWPALRVLGEPEIRRLAQAFGDVHQLYTAGHLDQMDVVMIAVAYYDAATAVLRMTKGLGTTTVRKATREALDAAVESARAAVNSAVGFVLI